MADINYRYDDITKNYMPTAYPVREKYDMQVPEEIAKDFNQLTSFIEDKYAKEFLKICAFYNKLFVSLKALDYSRASYNTIPFTLQYQERSDTGTGLASNYLKAAMDLVISRIGNIQFKYMLKCDRPSVRFVVYKDEVERILRSFMRKNRINELARESFHDAAIVAFAHAFIDPWVGEVRKVADWELGFYESEFSAGSLQHAMIRDFAFPISRLDPYLDGFDPVKVEEWKRTKTNVDLRLYFDCTRKKKWVAVGGDMGPETEYPFDKLLIATLSWDLGVRRTTVASLFDSLYPLQRQMDKLLAKKTQILNQYKGPVPVISGTDYDVVLKSMNNTAGEILFLDTQRKVTELITTLEATPLDPQLNAEFESLKSQMFELAGAQQISLDPENYRSAASMIAQEQMRDAGFQTQLASLAQYNTDIVAMFVEYQAVVGEYDGVIDWEGMKILLDDAYIDAIPIHDLDPTVGIDKDDGPEDFMQQHIDRLLVDVCKGNANYNDCNFSYDGDMLKAAACRRYVELLTLDNGGEGYVGNLLEFLVELFVQDIQAGLVPLETEENKQQDAGGAPDGTT